MASTWKELKAEGNSAYSSGDLGLAVEKYTAALQTDIAAADRATVLCNRAQCYLKQDQFSNAIEDCTACLTASPDNVKALFRRAVAYEKNGSKAEATQDYDTVLKLNPTIEEASAGYQRCAGKAWRPPPSKKARGPARQLTQEDLANIAEVEGRVKDVARQKKQAQEKAMAAQREKRSAELMSKVLGETPAEHGIYRSVGKVFMKKDREHVSGWLSSKLSGCETKLQVCNTTLEYLGKQEAQADAAFLELVKSLNGGRVPGRA